MHFTLLKARCHTIVYRDHLSISSAHLRGKVNCDILSPFYCDDKYVYMIIERDCVWSTHQLYDPKLIINDSLAIKLSVSDTSASLAQPASDSSSMRIN